VYVDLLAGWVHWFDPAKGLSRSVEIGEPVSAVTRDAEGWLLAVETGIQRRDRSFALTDRIDVLERPTLMRMNDGSIDARGRFYVGSLSYDGREGRGCLYRFDPDGSWRVLAEGLGVSNGIGWSPGLDRLYHVDSAARTVYVRSYDEDTGELGAAEVFYLHPHDGAVPDGIAIDVAGGLWVVLWDGARIIRLDARGAISDVVAVPAPRVTSVAFGGPGLATLFITSARIGLDEATLHKHPASGQLFSFVPSIPGLAIPRPAGGGAR